MEPFSISCTTCQAKLRVRNASAIGQIQTCPKCGSMVLIEAPATSPGQPAGPDKSTGQVKSTGQDKSAGRDKPRVPTADRSGHRPPPRPGTGVGKKPNDFADTVEDPTHYGTAKPADPTVDAHGDAQSHQVADSHEMAGGQESADVTVPAPDFDAAADLGASSYDEMPDPEWIADGRRQRRRWILAGGAMIAGVGLAIAAFVYLASRNTVEVVQAKDPTNSITPVPASQNGGPTTVPAVSDSPANEPQSVDGPAEPAELSSTETSSKTGADSETKDEAALPRPPPPATSPPGPTDPIPFEPPATPTAEPGLPAVPPDLVPKDKNKDDRVNARAKADRMTPGGSLSDTLRKLGGLFDDTDDPPTAEPIPGEPATATPVESADSTPAVESPRLPRPDPRNVDIAARLADPIVEIEFTETPLQDFLQFVSTLSTIPITLDPDALPWLKVNPNTPVTVRLSATTVAQLLETTLSKVGLTALAVDQHLLVTRKGASDGTLRKAQRNVADLIGDETSQSELLRELILALIARESWADAGGKGTAQITNGLLEVEQTEPVVLEISTFLERLRVARGLPKKSTFEEKLFQTVSRSNRAAPQLSKAVTLNYSRPTSFPKVVRRLALESGVSILIDWNAVAQAGWNPDAEVTLTVTEKPLREALEQLVQPMELAYRIVDESTFQITVPAELETRQELEFYRVNGLAKDANEADGLMKRIGSTVAMDWFSEAGGVLKYDPSSRCLLVLLPQPRQQVLEKLLLEWNSTGK